jgi:signal peptidase I
MATVAVRKLRALVTHPVEILEDLLLEHRFIPSLTLGMISYYWSTLQISEILLPPSLGGRSYFLLNLLVSLGHLILTVLLIHLACWLVTRTQGGCSEILTLWGYTQLPWIILIALVGLSIVVHSLTAATEAGIVWVFSLAGAAFFLWLWGVILKLQALKICYALVGKSLLGVIGLALVLNGCLAWAERFFIAERGLVSQRALRAMDLTVDFLPVGRRNFALSFDTLTYHLRSPERGEVVAFLPPGRAGFVALVSDARLRSLGRIVGLPGETAEVRQGRVYIGTQMLEEPYLKGSSTLHMPPMTLAVDQFLILGDDRSLSPADYGGGLIQEERIRGRLTDVGRLKWRFLVGRWPW